MAKQRIEVEAFHHRSGRFPRAIGLLASCLFFSSGCLAPQEIEQVDPPESGNSAPVILARSPESTTVVTQLACGKLWFELLGVRDRDRKDTLEVRWFVNYGAHDTTIWRSDTLPPPPEDASDIRLSPPFDLDTDGYVGQLVVVEAVVSDGFDPDPAAEPRDRAILPNKGYAQTGWIVQITDVECLER